MSYFSYIAFPRKLKTIRFFDIQGKEKDYGINYDTTNFRKDILLFPDISPDENHIVLVDKKEATFNDCFKNPFIYEYHVYIPNNYHHLTSNIITSKSDGKIKTTELERIANEKWFLYKKVQYNFIILHAQIGEFVEIYTEMTDHVNFNLGPPASKSIVSSDEFMNLPISTEIINKHKMTIFI